MTTLNLTSSQVKASSKRPLSDYLIALLLVINAAFLYELAYRQAIIEEQLELLIWMRDHCRFI